MKILIGVLLALAIGLGLTGWQLRQSLAREGAVQVQLAGVKGALETAQQQNGALASRFDSLDQAVKSFGEAQRRNQADLTKKLATIKNIVQEPGDSNESISCLDVRVPAQLDRGMR